MISLKLKRGPLENWAVKELKSRGYKLSNPKIKQVLHDIALVDYHTMIRTSSKTRRDRKLS